MRPTRHRLREPVISVLLARLRQHRDRTPDRVAVRFAATTGQVDTTWAQLYATTLEVLAAGRRPDRPDRRAVVVDGSAESIATVLGLTAAGVDVALIEQQSSVLTDPWSPLAGVVTEVIGPAGAGFAHRSYREARSVAPATPAAVHRDGELLQLTSGSTGDPKLVRQSVASVAHGGATYRDLFRLRREDVLLVPVPLAHSFGFVGGLVAALTAGATLTVLPRFTPRLFTGHLAAGATVLLGTPMLYRLAVTALRSRPDRLRVALSSGGPLSAELAGEAAESLGVTVRQVYGSTEAGLIACQPPGRDWPPDAVGLPAPGVEVRIGPQQRLLVRSPTLLRGYLGVPGDFRTADGFYDTGDLAEVDDHGRLRLAGRKATFVNVGGRKVNPGRVARIIAECPGVHDVVVYGAPDGDGEQQLHAAVVLEPGVTTRHVTAFCRARQVLPYEVPRHVHELNRLPYTAMGKIDHRRLLAATVPAALVAIDRRIQ